MGVTNKENQFLDLAALRSKWNPEKKTIRNVTKSDKNVGCVAVASAPLQAAHFQPGHSREYTKEREEETNRHRLRCTIGECTTQISVGYSPPNTPVVSQLPAHDHPRYVAYTWPGRAAYLGYSADTNRRPTRQRKQCRV